jgi:GTP cyclohydrolase II
MTNNPAKVEELRKDGFDVEQITHRTEANDENREYLRTKASKMNHKL